MITRLTQKQRSAKRRLKDNEMSRKCRDRADGYCERCCEYCPYRGAAHHDYRRNNYPHLRHELANLTWLCVECHRAVHAQVEMGHEDMRAIRIERGDSKYL